MLKIFLLGTPAILNDGQNLKIPRRKSRAMFYYLADQTAPVAREHLLSFFWADTPRPSALQTLRTTLSYLRKILPEGLEISEDRAGLAAGAWIDVHHFSELLDPPVQDKVVLGEVLDAYRGDFLADFYLPDNPSFEDWLVVERERYRRLAVRGLSDLSRQWAAERNYQAAIDPLNRALAFDPLQEDIQRERIRLLYLAGDRPAAIRAYDQLRRLLDEELGMPPMVETRALYDDLINDRLVDLEPGARKTQLSAFPSGLHSPGFLLPFAGRAAELERMHSLVGSHQLLLVEGEPGIGKTRLVEEFLKDWPGFKLVGSARELEKNLPYQPITEALRGLFGLHDWAIIYPRLSGRISPLWMRELARLLPEFVSPLDPAGLQRGDADESRLWEAVHQFLLALSSERPVAMFIDDLHWADMATLGLLGYLLRQPDEIAPLFLAAARSAQPRSPLLTFQQSMTRAGRLSRLELLRLTQEDTNTIAGQIVATDQNQLANWLLKSSEGIPLVVNELIRYARENQILVDRELHLNLLPPGPVVPQTIYSLLQTRLDRLTDNARRILDTAVAAGREFDFELVARAAALSESAALDAIDELTALNLVHPLDEKRFRFSHSLIPEVAYREAGEIRHRILHRRLAETMLASLSRAEVESQAGIVAFHFAEGNAPDRAAPFAFQAGQQAANLAAWSEATVFFEMALRGTQGEARIPILTVLGQVRLRIGPSAQASEAYHEALNLAEKSRKPDVIDAARLALAQSLLPQARYEEAIDLARQAINAGLPEHKIDAEFLWGTALSLEGSDLQSAAAHLRAAEEICCGIANGKAGDVPSKRDPSFLARIRFELGSVAAQQGNLERAVELYRQAMETACGATTETAIIWCILAHNNLAYHLHLLGDPDAITYAQDGLRLAQENGIFEQQPYLYSTLGEIALAQGLLEHAEDYFNRGLALAERLAMEERLAGLTANLGLVALQQGKNNLAIHRLSSALARAEAIGTSHLATRIKLWLAPLLPPEEARGVLQSVRIFAQNSGRQKILEEAEELIRQLDIE